jgi:ATPase family associated with various cellular activities (AAA)
VGCFQRQIECFQVEPGQLLWFGSGAFFRCVKARDSVIHSHRDYIRAVGNSLLEMIDGIRGVNGKEGVCVIGCTNAIEICDPALLRSGRLERVIRVGLCARSSGIPSIR